MQEKSHCRDPNMVSSGVIRNFRSVVVPPSRQARQLPMHSLAVSGAAKRREYELSTVVMSRVDSELLGPEAVYSATEHPSSLKLFQYVRM